MKCDPSASCEANLMTPLPCILNHGGLISLWNCKLKWTFSSSKLFLATIFHHSHRNITNTPARLNLILVQADPGSWCLWKQAMPRAEVTVAPLPESDRSKLCHSGYRALVDLWFPPCLHFQEKLWKMIKSSPVEAFMISLQARVLALMWSGESQPTISEVCVETPCPSELLELSLKGV